MVVIKKVNGDSYAEIIREDKDDILSTLINLKPLDPSRLTNITNNKGKLTGYEYQEGEETRTLKPFQVLHFCNDRTIDEPHGNSVTSAIEWVVTAIEEAKTALRRVIRLSYIRILYIDENDTTRLNQVKAEYKDGVEKGYVLIIPCKPEDAKFQDITVPPTEAYRLWLDYLEDQFYKQIGVPKVVLGGTAENTEASAKVGVIGYEPTWQREIKDIEMDVWNQLGIKITFGRQPSLMDNMQADERKNTGQTKLEYQGAQ